MVDWAYVFKIAEILAIPITVVLALIILRPIFHRMMKLMTKVELGPFEIERGEIKLGEAGQDPAEAAPTMLYDTRRKIAEGLAEGSKEKLERLRLALETEQVNQLIQYHANSLAQSRISFYFSIGAGTLGFLVIILGTVLMFFGASNLQTAVLSVASGTIIDAVAALFFTQSNRARRLMTEFFDKLRLDRRFNESLRLCHSVPNKTIQSNLKARLSLFFAGVPYDAIFDEVKEEKVTEK